jgi:hypothetical protein
MLITIKFKAGSLKFNKYIFLWLSFLIFHALYSILIVGNSIVPIIGLYTYFIPFLYWYLYLDVYKDVFSINKYFKFYIFISVLVSAIGVYQYFADMSLWGFASSLDRRFALDAYYKYSVIRISSLFTSTQILSIFILLATILVLENSNKIKKNYLIALILLFLFTAALTGSQIILLGIITYFIYYVVLRNKNFKRKTAPIIIIGLLLVLFTMLIMLMMFDYSGVKIETNSPIIRVFRPILNFDQFIYSESALETSRINVYKRAIMENDSIFLGSGLGTSNSIAVSNRQPLESFLFQVFIETGIIGLLIFLFMFKKIYSYQSNQLKNKGFIMVIVVTMLFNQAYNSVVFIPIYAFLIYPMIMHLNGPKMKKENNKVWRDFYA